MNCKNKTCSEVKLGELTKACQRISILAVLRVTAQSLVRTINSISSKSFSRVA
jgi:hypothetical protein